MEFPVRRPRARRPGLIFIIVTGLLAGIYGWPGVPPLQAEKEPVSPPKQHSTLDPEVEKALAYLLGLAQDKDRRFAPGQVRALVDYCLHATEDAGKETPGRRFGGSGAIVRDTIRAPMARFLRYAYNPHIPSYLVLPKMLRLSGWHPESDLVSATVPLWEMLPTLEEPVMLHGREFEVTTPDIRTGGYYRYWLDRLIILLRHRDDPVLISVSRLTEPSEVGRRAFIIDDANWMYFYSNETGLSLNWMQWMDTYIYDTGSVTVFHTQDNRPRSIGVTMFKWLNAGWWGMNVVRETHIRQGCQRSLHQLKKVIESDDLPALDALADSHARVQSLSEQNLDRLTRNYAENFESIALNHEALSGEKYTDILRNGGYARLLNRQERIGAVMLEYLKTRMGKKSLIDPELVHRILAESPAGDSNALRAAQPEDSEIPNTTALF